MPYEAQVEVLDDHIRVEVAGERVPGSVALDASLVMEKTIEVINRTGISNCLVILNLAGSLSAMDSFDMVSISEDVGWKRDFRVALVNTQAESLEDAQFTEIVASNRAYPLRVFDNEEDAKHWLLSTPHNA
jgi:hypothetical protein